MTKSFMITLSWPAPALWENRKTHWAQKARAKKAARREAWALALEAGITYPMPTARLQFAFYPPTNHRRDAQNMPATQKAAIDGIADAMGCDDSGFRVQFPDSFERITPGGAVVVRVFPDVVLVPMRGVVT